MKKYGTIQKIEKIVQPKEVPAQPAPATPKVTGSKDRDQAAEKRLDQIIKIVKES